MLSPTSKKFMQALSLSPRVDAAGEHLPNGYSIQPGRFSSRIENGIRISDATLLKDGKFVATYNAATDEVFQ